MKKNILFVMPSLAAGGGEKSLVNLLSQIDYDSYNVDLLLFSKTGVFLNSIPRQVNLLELPTINMQFSIGLVGSLKTFLGNGNINLAYNRLMFTIKNRSIKNRDSSEQQTWKYVSKSYHTLERQYDVAIGFLEKSSIYFIVDKVKSRKKIGWIHTNYTTSGMDAKFDKYYFGKLDHIITVSEECANSLKDHFLHLKSKVQVIYNIVSPKIINNLSGGKIKENLINDENYCNIITLARLSREKGIDMAIKACKILKDKGYKVSWYVLGEGSEQKKLQNLIERNNLQNNFKLLGVRENPYPYLKKANVYVQPSRYEGKSIAIDEAKILHKPIVVTNFETAKDQIANEINGLIVKMNENEIAAGIEKIINNIGFKDQLIKNLEGEKLGTEEEINKLYNIFRG